MGNTSTGVPVGARTGGRRSGDHWKREGRGRKGEGQVVRRRKRGNGRRDSGIRGSSRRGEE